MEPMKIRVEDFNILCSGAIDQAVKAFEDGNLTYVRRVLWALGPYADQFDEVRKEQFDALIMWLEEKLLA